MSTTKICMCTNCQHPFSMALKEFTRQTKNGRNIFFCSRSCATTHRNNNLPEETKIKNIERLKSYGNDHNKGNSYAKKGKFTYFLNRARNRKVRTGRKGNYEFNLTENYLNDLWTAQHGRCALSGVSLELPKNVTNTTKIRSLFTASLDRIDSNEGYIEGNVQFLAWGINLAKNNRSVSEMIELIDAIRWLRGQDSNLRHQC